MHRAIQRCVGLVLTLGLVVAACGSDGSETDAAGDGSLDGVTITVYSGRGEDLIGPVFDALRRAHRSDRRRPLRRVGRPGAAHRHRGRPLAGRRLHLPESRRRRTPRPAGAALAPLGGHSRPGRRGLPGSDGNWVGITGRVRVLVYNPDLVDESELPSSVLDLTDPAYAGRVGVAPDNGSFQDFVTAMRASSATTPPEHGSRAWRPTTHRTTRRTPPSSTPSARGEVDMGLVNHYYLAEALEEDPDISAVNHFFPAGDLGSLLIVSAAGVIDSSDDPAAAEPLLKFLLSDEAQAASASAETRSTRSSPVSPFPRACPPGRRRRRQRRSRRSRRGSDGHDRSDRESGIQR